MTNVDYEELLATTRDVVATTIEIQRSILAEPRDFRRLSDLQERLEDLWRELDEFERDRFREEHENDPFPESPETVLITTPFPPTLNHNVARNGKRYFRDKDYETFIELVGYEWRRVRPKQWNPERRYATSIKLFYNTKRRYDVDNRVKPILDALTKAGVWNDDSQVDVIRVERCEIDKKNPRAEIAIVPIS